GTFNNWDPKATPMKRSEGGDWVYTLDLSPGRYEYKFVIDGQWCCEPGCDKRHDGCPRCVPNELGTMNRLLEVKGLGRQPAARHVPA
ncbi:MAG: glycogen-binding domain-containing protein, partial [Phycisphaerales bacterium]|nr:glycogen-binding domain-containing protein [Phycisphaerales bacterium]